MQKKLLIVERLQRQLGDFLDANYDLVREIDTVKVYYDCGQAPVTKLLQDTFEAKLGERIEFAQGVKPENYKLFQLADLICSVKLISTRLKLGLPMTYDEFKFFGGPRRFQRNVLKQFGEKEI